MSQNRFRPGVERQVQADHATTFFQANCLPQPVCLDFPGDFQMQNIHPSGASSKAGHITVEVKA
jgi:hypothetical protein